MKKLILMTSIMLAGMALFSQPFFTNGGFETWNDELLYRNPDPWFSSNMQLYIMGAENNVTRTEDAYHGTYAAHLETVNLGSDTILGMMMIANGYDLMSGGIPYSTTPDSMYCYAKFDIQPDDTATLGVFFRNNGSNVGGAFITFTGEQVGYQRFSTPVNTSETPDSLSAFVCSSTLGETPDIPGSEITIDSIGFVGGDPFPNGDLENWNDVIVEEPYGWFTTNYGNVMDENYPVTKSNDSYAGNYAARIENTVTMWGDTMGLVTKGILTEQGPAGGFYVDDNPSLVSGYYKYTPVSTDTAMAMVTTSYYDDVAGETVLLDSFLVMLPEVSGYTYFELPLSNTVQQADTLNIVIAAGNMNDSATAYPGSVLILDEMTVDYYQGIISGDTPREMKLYPNPAESQVWITTAGDDNIRFELYDLTGRRVFFRELSQVRDTKIKLNVSDISEGTYIYKCHSDTQTSTGKFVITR
ncbi:MAG: T9SS type A sorting domain-containing protein [Bacteroidota bacterium]|nr:T9SS type A sorting domain-containing protein [Bacteroidota bacterium]